MTIDISRGIALLLAYLDEDGDACEALTHQTDPSELVTALLLLCQQLGATAYGDTLHDVLRDALTSGPPQPGGHQHQGGT
ncbi:hypothetical protein [Micromonospora aurantiaca (nom. illeg.)]|uniref:hypothetical protein n=1 Tax=Micromonospora aurantiaca (nom. illeg.) TaxID=47850 RepID=UPI0016168292